LCIGGDDVFDRRCDESKRYAPDAKQRKEDRGVVFNGLRNFFRLGIHGLQFSRRVKF
jgi:hypothetical protein